MKLLPTYADIALPVPLDQPFTYSLPETLQHRVQPGCRLIVPLARVSLPGSPFLFTIDRPQLASGRRGSCSMSSPYSEPHLIELGRWMAGYYCAPLGEALRVMTPLRGEIHSSKVWSLTEAGTDAARQLLLGADDADPGWLLRLLEGRPLTDSYLRKKLPESARILKTF